MNAEIKTRTVISTLGPAGTCSEHASRYFLEKRGGDGDVVLFESFESAIDSLGEGTSDFVIVPSAYRRLADLVFMNYRQIEIAEVFCYATPSLVLAYHTEVEEIRKVACHRSPRSLVQQQLPDAKIKYSKSNSDSVRILMEGHVDACLTTVTCAGSYPLKILHDFGPIPMGWNVMRKKGTDFV